MTRKFYTDPLQAAWMSKHFGMRFTARMNNGLCGFGIGNLVLDLGLAARYAQDKDFTGVFELEPESLRLLEPQDGDLALRGDEIGDIFRSNRGNLRWALGDESFPLSDDLRVIWRAGKAFHWPESDESADGR